MAHGTPHRTHVALAVALTTLAIAPSADATTVDLSGTTLVVSAGIGQSNGVSLRYSHFADPGDEYPAGTPIYHIRDPAGMSVGSAGSRCTANASVATCEMAGIALVDVRLLDLDDTFECGAEVGAPGLPSIPLKLGGGSGRDTIRVQQCMGADDLDGGEDGDTISAARLFGPNGADVLAGGGSILDTVLYDGSTPVAVDNDDVADDGAAGEGDNVRPDVENIQGGSAADQITGNGADNVLVGGGAAAGAADVLSGGAGDDTLIGNPFLDGAAHMSGGAGVDDLRGGAGPDQLDGGDDSDMIDPGAGLDQVTGGPGTDLLAYWANPRTTGVTVSLKAGTADTGDNADTLSGIENVQGTDFGDVITGDDGPNDLVGVEGNDRLNGLGGADRLIALGGDDLLRSLDGAAGDQNFCGTGNDRAVADTVDTSQTDCEVVTQEEVSIVSGPSGLTRETGASFEFVAPGASAGHFECALDTGAFSTCTSPASYSGLADGEHRFQVRHVPDEGPATDPVERRWTVDTTPPTVTFDSAPSGDDNPPDATVEFHSSEPDGAVFRCQLDAEPEVDCSSPRQLLGLSAGTHTLKVKAFDKAGNEGAVSTVEWRVRAGSAPDVPPPPPPPACSGDGQTQVTFGVIVARALEACFTRTGIAGGQQVMASSGAVLVNGLRITPKPGSLVVVDPVLRNGTVEGYGPTTLSFGSVSWDLPTFVFDGLAQGALGVLNRVLELGEETLSMARLNVVRVGLEFSLAQGGQTKVFVRLRMPDFFQGVPGNASVSGLTAEVSATASNSMGATFGGKLKLTEAYVFRQFKMRDISLAYDNATQSFTGEGTLFLKKPGVPDNPLTPNPYGAFAGVTAILSLGPNGILGPLRRFSLQASALERPIGAHGFYFQRFGADLKLGMDNGQRVGQFGATAGISWGKYLVLTPFFEGEPFSLDGFLAVQFPVGDSTAPFSTVGEGAMKILAVNAGNAKVVWRPPDTIDLSGNIDLTVFGAGFRGDITRSWIDLSVGHNVEGAGQFVVPLLGTFRAEFVNSHIGYVVCTQGENRRWGWGRRNDEALVRAFVDTCELGPFRAGPSASASRRFEVRRGATMKLVAVKGASAPPKITVIGPRGERVETPAGPEGIERRDALLLQRQEDDTTYVLLFNPRPGTWRVSGEAGRMRVADNLPPLRIRARVTGRGPRRALTWNAGELPPKHRITFVETGRVTKNFLFTTRRARGRKRFRPQLGADRARRIQAIVTNDGLTRDTFAVARYRVPRPAAPVRVRELTLRRGTLRWRAQDQATGYALALVLPDGTASSRTVRGARLRIPGLPKRGLLRVTIVAMDRFGRVGPARSARLKL